MDGIVNLLKEPGPTSHDMVQKIRRLLKIRRVGHAGTLDPGASGVLVIGVGKATRVLEYLQEKSKTYIAEVVFGQKTTTGDSFGEVILSGQGRITRSRLESVLAEFTGPIKQIPPMASAIKLKGKKLYELMRQGIEVERQPRDIVIHSLKILKAPEIINISSRILLKAHVSKGTYIRSLCQDIGEKVGLEAHMGFLLRTDSGTLSIKDAYLLEEISRLHAEDRPFLIPIDQALDFPLIHANPETTRALMHGQSLSADDVAEDLTSLALDQLVSVYSADGLFAGIYRYTCSDALILKPEKIFIS